MRDNLFRREVLGVQRDHFFGDAVFYQPLTLRVLLLSAAGFFFVVAGFAASASIKQTENVRGFIYATNGEVKVYGNRSGVVEKLHVSNGQLVSQGQALVSLIEPGYDQTGDAAKQAIIRRIEHQISHLEARLLLSAERQRLAYDQSEKRELALREEILIRAEEYDLSMLQLEMAEGDYARLERLWERGAISESELTHGKASLISMRKSFQNMRMALQSTARLKEDSRHGAAVEQARLKDEQIALQISLSQLEQRREEALYEQNFTVAAPVSGRINNLLLSRGDQLDPHRPFVSIVADAPDYEAQIFVPSRALGKIKAGQKVLLNYDAFPYQQYGSYEAVVSSIGTAVIDPREHLIPLDINEPVYLIKAELLPLRHNLSLRSGMQFSAQLVTGQRTILQGIMEPLTSLARRL
ncbi:MAG: HlyD family efflux transporter periplasmic adaptor subunit [Pseudohongiella sp.]|nr:HlyD family efflux transporter periplasmic adaptor subunit [Pseudohongiella sp.]